MISRAEAPINSLLCSAAPPAFDILRLLPKLPCVYAGWDHTRAPSRKAFVPGRPWCLSWVELRGGYPLLSREDEGSRTARGQRAQERHSQTPHSPHI